MNSRRPQVFVVSAIVGLVVSLWQPGDALAAGVPPAITRGDSTSRVSVSSAGTQADLSSLGVAVSADARYVAFASDATNLVAGDTNGATDVFVRDITQGTTERVSVTSGGGQIGSSSAASGATLDVSDDGRYVVFTSSAGNVVPGDTNGVADVFVRDRIGATTTRVSVAASGAQSQGDSSGPSVSGDGRYVAFASAASNLTAGDTNGVRDVFVHDRVAGTTDRVSLGNSGIQGNQASSAPVFSDDGRYVSFASFASNLVSGDTNGFLDVFVRDRVSGTTERASLGVDGVQGNGIAQQTNDLSADGRFVLFSSAASNLVPGDTNMTTDVFVRDRRTGTTERVSLGSGGAQGDVQSNATSISRDGRYVSFTSSASTLVDADTNLAEDFFVRDRVSGVTARLSVGEGGVQANATTFYGTVSDDGLVAAFYSAASNLVPGDTNARFDVFVRGIGVARTTSSDVGGGLIAAGAQGVEFPLPAARSPGRSLVRVLSGPNAGRTGSCSAADGVFATCTAPAYLRTSEGVFASGILSLPPPAAAGVDIVEVHVDGDGDGVKDGDEIVRTVRRYWYESTDYHALGDSYSAGDGVTPYDTGGGRDYNGADYCSLSRKAYPRLADTPVPVRGPLSPRLARLADRGIGSLEFYACTSAVTEDVLSVAQRSEGVSVFSSPRPPQVSRVTSGVDLVTFTIGGNDLGFARILEFCGQFVPPRPTVRHETCRRPSPASSRSGPDRSNTSAHSSLWCRLALKRSFVPLRPLHRVPQSSSWGTPNYSAPSTAHPTTATVPSQPSRSPTSSTPRRTASGNWTPRCARRRRAQELTSSP